MWVKRFKIFGYILILCIFILFLVISSNKNENQKNRPNIIILLLDCVRADHLGCYGYHRDTTPHIDALAAQGTKFNKAISQAPWTLPSVVSLLSGCYPHRHGAGFTSREGRYLKRNHKDLQMPSSSISLLPELLRQNNYQTWGFSTNLYADNRSLGKRGFDEFKFQLKAPAEKVVDYGINKILSVKNSKRPFFLYLHFMDAHHPIQPPGKYYNFFPCSDGKNNEKRHEWWEFKKREEQHGTSFENYREHKISLYDGSIRYMDEEIGRLITELAGSTLANDTIVVVLADHGDEFWDHADFQASSD